ncbi:carboxypeptidase regulatory-like domain-containing protein [Rasiella rasia]|uniref:Carboxypeptidase regulatory-like domain-containing protein n=1 Tax=Rasiella rasia TaxID=2744027 RepID=A0A6G6GS56_9FLAO|nr:carboxypeptidase-like regulatory domain-containing protein [Rasiella rasia]QIE60541.1 carboxypeptidase regulatory-like domain-containing protein [Rasiella rasia]
MMTKDRYLYISTFLVLVLALFSCNEDRIGEDDTGSVSGTVVASGTNVPLANVRIATQPISSTVFTDSLGTFLIENVPVGDYAVEARVEDFITDFEPTTVVANATVNVVFELEVSTANNRPPTSPQLLTPAENEVLQGVEATFSWTSEDPDGDPIEYAIELRNDQNDDVLRFEEITDTTYTYSPLILGAKYVWQVTATDNINDPVLSPLGTFSVVMAPVDNRILFTRNIEGNNVIFSADEDGSEFQLTPSDKNSFRPVRNVAANRIAFLQADGAEVDVFTMNRDGSDTRKITSSVKPAGFNLNEINISWPENSTKVYFPVLDKLYRINTTGQGLELVYQTTDGSLISEVDAHEFDNVIALKTNNLSGYNTSIIIIDNAGNLLDTLFSNMDGAVSGLELSVDNNQVLYTYDVSEFQNAAYRRLDSRVFIYNRTTDVATEISGAKENGTNDLQVKYSPNEAEVILMNTSNDGISIQNIVTLEVDFIDNDGQRVVFKENAFMPDWE